MKEKFCPRCGKETEELVDSLCRNCFKEKKDWVKIPDKLTVTVCQSCARKESRGWEDIPFEEAVRKKLEQKVTSEGKIEKIYIETEDGLEEVGVEVRGVFKGVEMSEEKNVEVEVEEELCEGCKKIKTGYFEAKVQIRLEDDKGEQILDECEKILKERGKDEVMVSGLEETENGFDIFMASNSAAKYLAKRLSEKHEVERKNTKTLQGLKDGNKVYRSTYLVRILRSS